jgi:hypothetical protein
MSFPEWHLQAGDPTPTGWMITGLYLAVTIACAVHAAAMPGTRHRKGWSMLALVLLLMGINKQLDLQTDFNAFGRMFLLSHGWYVFRQTGKKLIVAGTFVSGSILMMLTAWKMKWVLRHYWLVITGILMLFSFIILRASSLYGVPFLGALGKHHGSWLLEPLGLFVTGAAVWYDRHLTLKSRRPDS